jgi:hypothetical protein
VEISAAVAWIKRGREMALNGTNLQAGTMSAGGVKLET